jgi:hypothetical protein
MYLLLLTNLLKQEETWRRLLLICGETQVIQEYSKSGSNGMRDSDQWIEKSDYLRLRSLTLGYTFDKSILGEGFTNQ